MSNKGNYHKELVAVRDATFRKRSQSPQGLTTDRSDSHATNELAREAAEKIDDLMVEHDFDDRFSIGELETKVQPIILAAIEKAREPLVTAIKTAINENDMMPLFMVLDEQ